MDEPARVQAKPVLAGKTKGPGNVSGPFGMDSAMKRKGVRF